MKKNDPKPAMLIEVLGYLVIFMMLFVVVSLVMEWP